MSDLLSQYRPPQPSVDSASAQDLYLQPHFDDICFSLGAYVGRRRQGTLLTLFSRSAHVAKRAEPHLPPGDRVTAVSALREGEDLAFARAVGLHQICAGFEEAPIRGQDIFDTDKSVEDAARFAPKVMDAIAAVGSEPPAAQRPWLYCPMGIGGHVDHVMILRIVSNRVADLAKVYRLAFYEDLHYASNLRARIVGLARFRALLAPAKPRRSMHRIDDIRTKLAEINLYASQIAEPPTIDQFTPAQFLPTPAHEAIWTVDMNRDNR